MIHTIEFEFKNKNYKYEINPPSIGGPEGFLVSCLKEYKEQFHIYRNNLGIVKNDGSEMYSKDFNEYLMLLIEKLRFDSHQQA